ncbi:RNA polymerase sigma factor [Ferruginibacter sp.]
MSKINNVISAEEIISMIENNNSLGWQHLYDKYSPMMYGAILRLTSNEKLADKILIESFTQIKDNLFLLKTPGSLYLQLLHHTFITAKCILKNDIRTDKKDSAITPMFPIINSLLQQPLSVNEAAEINSVCADDLKLKLHEEVKQLRNKHAHGFKLHAVL